MATISYKQIERICKAKGLTLKESGNARIWKGFIDGDFCRVCLHVHASGRDIPNGTLNQYVKELKFKNLNEMIDFLNSL